MHQAPPYVCSRTGASAAARGRGPAAAPGPEAAPLPSVAHAHRAQDGSVARQEHVTNARLSAAQAAAAIAGARARQPPRAERVRPRGAPAGATPARPRGVAAASRVDLHPPLPSPLPRYLFTPNPAGKAPAPYDYLPFFYSRVFALSWVFYGAAPPGARVVTFGVPSALAAASSGEAAKFGAFWVEAGTDKIAGVFLESGSADEAAAAKKVAAARPAAPADLGEQGAAFLLAAAAKM